MERFFNKIWYQKHYSAYLLLLFSAIYSLGALISRQIQRCQKQTLPYPVVIVGNLTVGGTGKTPLVIALIEQLKRRGYTPGVISRGYKRKRNQSPQIVSDHADPNEVGDEPLLIRQRTHSPVVVARNRAQAAKYLLSHENIDVIISDDGLQNYSIPHDIEIAVIDGQRRFGNNLLLPAGPLREPVSRLERVDFKVTNGDARKGEFAMTMRPIALINCLDRSQMDIEQWHGRQVHACAGIGNPNRFFDLLRHYGISIYEHVFPDHHAYRLEDFNFGAEADIIMTEKDAVKCVKFATNKMWSLRISPDINQDFHTAFFARLDQDLKHVR